jgi:hypothetical protein
MPDAGIDNDPKANIPSRRMSIINTTMVVHAEWYRFFVGQRIDIIITAGK